MDVTKQVNPIVAAAYSCPGVLAMLFLTGVAPALRFEAITSAAWTVVWSALMLAGSLLACGAILAPRRYALISLRVECVGAAIVGVQFGLYVASLVMPARSGYPWFTIVVFSSLAVGFIARAVQAIYEKRRLSALVRALSTNSSGGE